MCAYSDEFYTNMSHIWDCYVACIMPLTALDLTLVIPFNQWSNQHRLWDDADTLDLPMCRIKLVSGRNTVMVMISLFMCRKYGFLALIGLMGCTISFGISLLRGKSLSVIYLSCGFAFLNFPCSSIFSVFMFCV